MNRLKEIETLKERIRELEQEELNEARTNVLPFIRGGNVICYYEGSCTRLILKPINDDKDKEFIRLIESKQDGGYYHFGCPVDDNVQARYDDGELSLRFDFSGKIEDVQRQFIQVVKRLQLNIDFSEYRAEIRRCLTYQQKRMDEVDALEKEILKA